MDHSSTIIERIGDTKYMFNYATDVLLVCDFNWSSGLRCYDDTILGLFETGIVDLCTYVELYNDIFENQLSSFQLAPNPTTDFIEIQMENGILDLVHLLDAQGRLLLKTKGQTIDLAGYQSGVYFIRVLQDGNWTSRRFVKH